MVCRFDILGRSDKPTEQRVKKWQILSVVSRAERQTSECRRTWANNCSEMNNCRRGVCWGEGGGRRQMKNEHDALSSRDVPLDYCWSSSGRSGYVWLIAYHYYCASAIGARTSDTLYFSHQIGEQSPIPDDRCTEAGPMQGTGQYSNWAPSQRCKQINNTAHIPRILHKSCSYSLHKTARKYSSRHHYESSLSMKHKLSLNSFTTAISNKQRLHPLRARTIGTSSIKPSTDGNTTGIFLPFLKIRS